MTDDARTWEYFAGLAFAYHDAPDGTDDIEHAWHELAEAIKHYRATGGREPRDPDELVVRRETDDQSLGYELLTPPGGTT